MKKTTRTASVGNATSFELHAAFLKRQIAVRLEGVLTTFLKCGWD